MPCLDVFLINKELEQRVDTSESDSGPNRDSGREIIDPEQTTSDIACQRQRWHWNMPGIG